MGNNDLKEMDTGVMDSSGRDLTNAGRLCGMIATALLILQAIVVVVIGDCDRGVAQSINRSQSQYHLRKQVGQSNSGKVASLSVDHIIDCQR